MYLHSLEVMGFKSFPEKIKLEFSRGINAIVGPNGCGKSNIVDAVRWGLGEQSVKLLRGSKMEEFIFNGTSNRRALNLAEVGLSFDEADKYLNTEYREIVVTRRLYRSGEGEYFLNKNSCRLKDITELFWDTGIGTDTYSLIGQGRIEQLVNARPEERRELFEEAAEVHKYRQRKKETFQRLQEMKENLLRVEDLLAELRSQHSQLSEKASRAREYKEILSELNEVDKKILILRYVKNEQEKRLIQKEQAKVEAKLQDKKNERDVSKDKISELQVKEKDSQEKLEVEETAYHNLKDKKELLSNKLNKIREKKNILSNKIEHKKNSLHEVNTRMAGMDETRSKNEEDMKIIAREAEELAEKTSQLKSNLSSLQHEEHIVQAEELKAEKEQMSLKIAALDQWFQDNYHQENKLFEKIDALDEQMKDKNQQYENLQAEENEAVENLQILKQKQLQTDRDRQQLQQAREKLDHTLKQIREKVNIKEKEIYTKKMRLEHLKENEEQLSYYSSGVRSVMQEKKEKNNFEGVHGPVAELIQVPSDLEKAIEVALGAAVQFIIVEDELSARKAINFLKENKAGRVTFLPLNLLKPSSKKEKALPTGLEGILGFASKLVKTHDKYRQVVDYLLNGILLVSTLDVALEIIRQGKRSWKIVTLDGEALTPGGTISGGSFSKERSGVLSRKADIKSLHEEIEQKNRLIAEDNKNINEIEEQINNISSKLKGIEQNKQEQEKKYLELQNEINNIYAQRSAVNKEIEGLKQEKSDFQSQLEKLKQEKANKEKQYNDLSESISAKEEELKELNQNIGFKKQELERLEKELVETRIKLSTLQEKESSLQETIDKQQKEKDRLEKVAQEFSQEINSMEDECQELEQDENKEDAALKLIEKEIEEKKDALSRLREDANSFKQEKELLQEKIEKERRSIERMEHKSHELHLKVVTLEESIKYLHEQSIEKYNYELTEELMNKEFTQQTEEDLTKYKQQLQDDLSAIGEVNLGVIEEYERLEKRISFLEEQREDLLEGEQGTRKILKELDVHIKNRFMQALNAIEENFYSLFARLFGGGKAYLTLSDPQNVLDSGIEITAQPPGKKLQNITLLSGGEKALTAIALLFAIFKYKPAPFCVLDEIESSLDDSNLERFLHLLREYTKDTQFILITHRKKTMEEADALFGITMEEQGVSKAISLSLTKKAG